MDALRRSRRSARWMLAWFAAFILAASIAPWVQAQPLQEVCSVAGPIQVAPQGGDPADHATVHPLKCALCIGLTAPPPVPVVLAVPPDTFAHALLLPVSSPLATLTRAPLPARGPPLFS
jgi:hypothetical protein